MTQFAPISKERHANRYWRRFSSYGFARGQTALPLVTAELPKAAMAMPIALLARDSGDASQGFYPAALLGLESETNLFVGPDGRWLGRYIPASLRGYPFQLAHADGERLILCVDEDSGLVVEADGEPFFCQDGEVSEPIRQVMEFLTQVERNRTTTFAACDRLQQHGLIEPWPVNLQSAAGERRIEGLFRVNEAALNALPPAALAEVRDGGGLLLAYCQLLAMQHLGVLGELAQARAARAPRLDDVFQFEDDGILHFGDRETS